MVKFEVCPGPYNESHGDYFLWKNNGLGETVEEVVGPETLDVRILTHEGDKGVEIARPTWDPTHQRSQSDLYLLEDGNLNLYKAEASGDAKMTYSGTNLHQNLTDMPGKDEPRNQYESPGAFLNRIVGDYELGDDAVDQIVDHFF